MKAIEFAGVNMRIAENQEEYETLPAYLSKTREGEVISCWELDEEEKRQVAATGHVWLSVWTFHKPLQPLQMYAMRPPQVPAADGRRAPERIRVELERVKELREQLRTELDHLAAEQNALVIELETVAPRNEETPQDGKTGDGGQRPADRETMKP